MSLVPSKPSKALVKASKPLPQKVAARYLTGAGDPAATENFRTDVDAVRYRSRRSLAKAMQGIGFFGLAVGGLSFSILSTPNHGEIMPQAAWTADWIGSAVMLGLTAAGTKLQLVPLALRRHVKRQLKVWLKERYNLESRYNTDVEVLVERAAQGLTGGRRDFIDDASGKTFRFMEARDGSGSWIEEVPEEKIIPNDYKPAGSPAALSPAHVDEPSLSQQLPLEAKALYEQGQALLQLAEGRTLSVEGEHVIKRVQEDHRQLLNLNAKLGQLGKLSPADSGALVEALRDLNEELGEVLHQEREGLSHLLHAQVGYIKGRKANTSERLQLPEASATMEPSASEIAAAKA